MKSILLTGASGFLGQYLLRSLSEHFNTITLGRHSGDIRCDLSANAPQLPKVDMVVHAAAQPALTGKEARDESLFQLNNCVATENLLRGLQASGLPTSMVFMSTVQVYGCHSGTFIDEDHPLDGEIPYARSKVQCESIVRAWGNENGVAVTILRLPLVVAMNAKGNLGRMIRSIRKGRYIRIGNGTAKRSMVHANDVAEFIPQLAGKEGTYNLTDGVHPTVRELEEAIAGNCNAKIRMKIPSMAATSLAKLGDFSFGKFPFNTELLHKISSDLTFSDAKARRELAWKPKSVLERLQADDS